MQLTNVFAIGSQSIVRLHRHTLKISIIVALIIKPQLLISVGQPHQIERWFDKALIIAARVDQHNIRAVVDQVIFPAARHFVERAI